jgi:hypothetical protein
MAPKVEPLESAYFDPELFEFLKRVADLGIGNVHELALLIEDQPLLQELIRNGDHNPTLGRDLSVEDLVARLEHEATLFLSSKTNKE